MISRRSVSTTLIALFCMVALGAAPVRAAETVEPVAFIKNIGQQAISSLTGKSLSDEERQAGFRKIFRRAFDVPTIARFSLGRYWRKASEEERKEYVILFEDFIVQAYAHRFKDYSGETFKVGKVQKINDSDQLVLSELLRPQGPPVQVHWRVRGSGNLRVVDVVVEGISMGITQRAEFASVIRNNGGKIASLLAALRNKTRKN
jgi:phospholipid transport system substrate-binding protein